MKARLVGYLAALTLVAPSLALAKPPDTASSRPAGERAIQEHSSSTSGAQSINANLRAEAERKYQKDGKVRARSQVIGTLVKTRSKVLYVRVDSGAVVPIDGNALSFHKPLKDGDVLRATFVVTDDLKNLATGIDRAVPASAGAGGK